jgi:hypothetical protein
MKDPKKLVATSNQKIKTDNDSGINSNATLPTIDASSHHKPAWP